MAKRSDGEKTGFVRRIRNRLDQMRQVYRATRRVDTRLPWILLAWFLGIFVVVGGLGYLLTRNVFLSTLTGLMIALAVTMTIFGRRAQTAAYANVEGQPGAAASVVESMRGDWRMTPAVGMSKGADPMAPNVVHRVIGKPGVILIGEGNPNRVTSLLAAERKRVNRVAPDVPVHEVRVGRGQGEVPLPKLQAELMRLPKVIKGPQIRDVESRMRALGAQSAPIPKGPLPRNIRPPKGMPR